MNKSKTFWAFAALVSFCAAAFSGYTIYNHLILHFAKDTLEIGRSVPLPAPEIVTEAQAPLPPASEPKEPADAERAGGGAMPQVKEEPQKVKAVKTHFEYKNASARSVFIAGSFTSWKEVKMARKNGLWKAEVYILPGNYIYHFTVDGKKILDPGKPKTAVGESIVEVK
ncbi:MAG: hypothetical protein A2X34_01120 [Elusimicrobia bacterium GWC2_51_8]|nr:MAG: hypothetical protein A2X33_10685 [Elusimicrobia bacterium GWA2_51_34]OGR61051.1 MAG: hypothetical protein A2X34_01120 [Elusimicrobia bacterium GWC2_51_8]OGR85505.1 MAG: hypothetical protein A2021_08755 [Elusimicrobia bacterium GWF2_52_66]HAF95158.1 hypothetical protein [Elusimicrobiota bacterium]HCE98412.1 hypothetical protein [Elusimicrobiota bacterium]